MGKQLMNLETKKKLDIEEMTARLERGQFEILVRTHLYVAVCLTVCFHETNGQTDKPAHCDVRTPFSFKRRFLKIKKGKTSGGVRTSIPSRR